MITRLKHSNVSTLRCFKNISVGPICTPFIAHTRYVSAASKRLVTRTESTGEVATRMFRDLMIIGIGIAVLRNELAAEQQSQFIGELLEAYPFQVIEHFGIDALSLPRPWTETAAKYYLLLSPLVLVASAIYNAGKLSAAKKLSHQPSVDKIALQNVELAARTHLKQFFLASLLGVICTLTTGFTAEWAVNNYGYDLSCFGEFSVFVLIGWLMCVVAVTVRPLWDFITK